MGRNRIAIDDNHFIIYGYDGPCDGYFIQYFDKESEEYKESDRPLDELGFFVGVSKNRVIEFLEKYNAVELAKKQTKKAFDNLVLDLPC